MPEFHKESAEKFVVHLVASPKPNVPMSQFAHSKNAYISWSNTGNKRDRIGGALLQDFPKFERFKMDNKEPILVHKLHFLVHITNISVTALVLTFFSPENFVSVQIHQWRWLNWVWDWFKFVTFLNTFIVSINKASMPIIYHYFRRSNLSPLNQWVRLYVFNVESMWS